MAQMGLESIWCTLNQLYGAWPWAPSTRWPYTCSVHHLPWLHRPARSKGKQGPDRGTCNHPEIWARITVFFFFFSPFSGCWKPIAYLFNRLFTSEHVWNALRSFFRLLGSVSEKMPEEAFFFCGCPALKCTWKSQGSKKKEARGWIGCEVLVCPGVENTTCPLSRPSPC